MDHYQRWCFGGNGHCKWRAAINTYTQIGTATGRWVPGVNDCNTWVNTVVFQSTPHSVLVGGSGLPGAAPTVVHNAVVSSDGSIHSTGAQSWHVRRSSGRAHGWPLSGHIRSVQRLRRGNG